MADGFQRLVQILKEQGFVIEGRAKSQWGAKEPGYRENIRTSLKEILNPEDQAELDDLKCPPRPAKWSVSISHAPHYGGWLAIPLPARIGFDIEAEARIRKDIVERMSTQSEILECPNPAFLWCAKEAYFKSLAQDQPQAITQLTIGQWTELAPDVYSFKASPHKIGYGWIVRAEPFLFGACLVDVSI